MIKVSIIVPVYNVEKYLKDCLESLINQTLKNIEIICINDGSSDASLNILREYEKRDSRIIVVDKKNEGQSIARNIGIDLAQGEYIGFVDSDDWVDEDYFEKLYNSAIKNECDIACAGYKYYKKNKFNVRKNYEAELLCMTVREKVRLDNLPKDNYIWNKIYKRSVWNDLGVKFQPSRFYEDIALVIKLLHKMGKMVVVPDTYYIYRANPNSTIRQKNVKHIKDYNWAVNKLCSYVDENNISLDLSKLVLKREYYKILNLTILKIIHYENSIKYKLFGFLPFGKKVVA